VADLNAALMQQVLDVAQRQRKPDVHRDRQADDLGTGFEAFERGRFGHAPTLRGHPARLNSNPSDKTLKSDETLKFPISSLAGKFVPTTPARPSCPAEAGLS